MVYSMRQKILIVEDEPALRETLKEYLWGTYDVVTASTGRDALRHLKEIDFKAILVDLNLPDLSGFNVIEVAKKNHKKTLILVITGDKQTETVQKAIEMGAHDYLTKPVDRAKLHKRIETAYVRRHINL